jgi:predicted TPR repeat methyltransferase
MTGGAISGSTSAFPISLTHLAIRIIIPMFALPGLHEKVTSRAMSSAAALHNAYAADYDRQVAAYGSCVAEALFGLCYEFVRPGQSVLDLGIGTGLSAALFAKAGLAVYGMDFSPAMLELCRVKGVAVGLTLHDVQATPWPYSAGAFAHVVCCGVLHFIPELETILGEAERVLQAGGLFAFTTKTPDSAALRQAQYEQVTVGSFDVFSHAPEYVQSLLAQSAFEQTKLLRCYSGQELFDIWVVQKRRNRDA